MVFINDVSTSLMPLNNETVTFTIILVKLIHEGAINLEDLNDFSDDLKERVKNML